MVAEGQMATKRGITRDKAMALDRPRAGIRIVQGAVPATLQAVRAVPLIPESFQGYLLGV